MINAERAADPDDERIESESWMRLWEMIEREEGGFICSEGFYCDGDRQCRDNFQVHLRRCLRTPLTVPQYWALLLHQPEKLKVAMALRLRPRRTECFTEFQVESPTPRTPLTRSMREWIFGRDGCKCQMCGADGRSLGVQLVIDHKKPLKRGGTNEASNLQTLCSKCNSKKGAKNTGYGDVMVEREEG